jgi:hypothetical protein
LIETSLPLISPRMTSVRPSVPAISTVGGRLGTSSDWIGGNVETAKAMMPTAAITAHSPSTSDQ